MRVCQRPVSDNTQRPTALPVPVSAFMSAPRMYSASHVPLSVFHGPTRPHPSTMMRNQARRQRDGRLSRTGVGRACRSLRLQRPKSRSSRSHHAHEQRWRAFGRRDFHQRCTIVESRQRRTLPHKRRTQSAVEVLQALSIVVFTTRVVRPCTDYLRAACNVSRFLRRRTVQR